MSGEARRESIVNAVLPLFARKGFANTTTRELAQAAGVSEALLYKHFPSKESLYSEIQNVGCKGCDSGLQKLLALEPSTSTLVYIVYYLMRLNILGRTNEPINIEARNRMLLYSCLEDGAFARYLFHNRFAEYISQIIACMDAAESAGDIVQTGATKQNRLLFTHHLATMIATMHLSDNPVVDYQVPREDLLNQAVWFGLRGLGLTDAAIARNFNPAALALFFGGERL